MKNAHNSRTQEFSIALILGGSKGKEKAHKSNARPAEGMDKLLNQWEKILDKTVEVDLESIERRIKEELG